MKEPTQTVGDGIFRYYLNWAPLGRATISARTKPVRLVSLSGHNKYQSDVFIQLYAVDGIGDIVDPPLRFFLAMAGLDFSYQLAAPIGFDRLVVIASTTPDSYTAANSTCIAIQAEIVLQ